MDEELKEGKVFLLQPEAMDSKRCAFRTVVIRGWSTKYFTPLLPRRNGQIEQY